MKTFTASQGDFWELSIKENTPKHPFMEAKQVEEGPETPSYRYGIPTILGHGTHEVTAVIAACIGPMQHWVSKSAVTN